MVCRFALFASLLGALSLAPGVTLAQENAVELVVEGPEGDRARRAFRSFVPNGSDASAQLAPFLVHIDTGLSRVRVWRRSDRVVLERGFDTPRDGYTLAIVASELLEMARSGGDPAAVGALVVAPERTEASTTRSEAESHAESESIAQPEPEPHTESESHPEPESWEVSVTPGLGVEGWLAADGEEGPWMVQPTLFIEVLTHPATEPWWIGGAVVLSGLGRWSAEPDDFEVGYARHDATARLSVGADVGPIRTRLLGHVRAGASVVVGGAAYEGDDLREETWPGGFVGLGLDVRQPVIEGLEVYLDVCADVLLEPVHFTARGITVATEPTLRVGGRLGVAYRFR